MKRVVMLSLMLVAAAAGNLGHALAEEIKVDGREDARALSSDLQAPKDERELWKIAESVPVSRNCKAGHFRKRKGVAYNGLSPEQVARVMNSFASTCSAAADAQTLYDCIVSSYSSDLDRSFSALIVAASSSNSIAGIEGSAWFEYYAGEPCTSYQVTILDKDYESIPV